MAHILPPPRGSIKKRYRDNLRICFTIQQREVDRVGDLRQHLRAEPHFAPLPVGGSPDIIDAMKICSIQAHNGPNRWARVPVLEVGIDTSHCNTDRWTGEAFRSQLSQWLPSADGQFAGQISPVLALGRVALALQQLAGVQATHCAMHAGPVASSSLITLEFEEERLARACLETARRFCDAAAKQTPLAVAAEIRKLADLADDVRMGPTTLAIVRAAQARGIPSRQIGQMMLVRLGEGCRQRRIWTAETDRTSAIGEAISCDKALTKWMLAAAGVPVPRGRPVASDQDAWAAACEVGLPVTVKPLNANHARGITLDARSREQVEAGYRFAQQETEAGRVIVEQFAQGTNHRILVIGDRVAAATRGERQIVQGDGRQTVSQLIDQVNREPGRGLNYTDLLDPIEVTPGLQLLLEQQGYQTDSIPKAGSRVIVQLVGDLKADVTDEVHPRTAAHAVLAARVVGLDVAGIDLVCTDIGQPLEEQGGAIVEVNAGPSLKMHLDPLVGKPRPVGEAIVDLIFTPEETGRIPVIVVGGSGPRDVVAAGIASALGQTRKCVGLATTKGMTFGGMVAPALPNCDREIADAVLLHPDVDVAILESRPDQARRSGLGCSRADVTVIVDLPEPARTALTSKSDEDPVLSAALAAVRSVPPEGVAVLPACAASNKVLAPACAGAVIYTAEESAAEFVREHLQFGGRAVLWRGGRIVLANGQQEAILPAPIDATQDRAATLAIAAVCWALDEGRPVP